MILQTKPSTNRGHFARSFLVVPSYWHNYFRWELVFTYKCNFGFARQGGVH